MKNMHDTCSLKDAKRSRQLDICTNTGREHHVRRNLLEEVARLFFVFSAVLVISCVQDLGDRQEPVLHAGDSSVLVTLSLTMPPVTRVMGTPGENKVDEIDVLLFTSDNEAYYYRAAGTGIENDPLATDEEVKTFTVKLPFTPTSGSYTSNNSYRLVVAANARAAIAAFTPTLAPSTIVTGGATSYTDVTDGLASSVANAMQTTRFPMWGEVAGIVISEGTPISSIGVNLTRAVARVDVSVESGVDFTLESVRLYHRNRKGLVAPGAASPHLPASPDTVKGPLVYAVPPGQESEFKKAIYTFEAAAGVLAPTTGWKNNTCLVIGGKFGGTTAPAASPVTYYRVEFAKEKSDAPGTYEKLALTRNHLYNVAIQGVNAHGWPDADKAYANLPSNIVVEITARDEGDLNDITFNDQHQIAVNKNTFAFYAEGYEKSIRVSTDYPGGWTVDINSLPSWLHVTAPGPVNDISSGVVNQTVTLTLAADPLAAGSRSWTFYIVAGKLEKEITVTQTSGAEFSLEVDPWELTFYKTPSTKTVNIYPIPDPQVNANYTLSRGSAGFTWATDDLAGNLLTLKPATNPGTTALLGTVFVTLASQSGQSITRVITVRQLAREMQFLANTSNPYPAAEGTYTFGLLSEGTWKLSAAAAWLALQGDESTFHAPLLVETPYSFNLTSNLSQVAPRSTTIAVTSSDEGFPSQSPFEIVQAGYPPYLVITSPAADADNHREIDLTGEVTVTFDTNADWKFTGDALYTATVASAQHASASIATATSILVTPASTVPVSRSVSFTPPAVTAETLAAGTTLESVVTFETTLGFPVATDEVTLKRTVQPRFSATFAPVSGSALPYSGASVTVTASTNAAWYAEGTGVSRQYAPATGYATDKTITLALPNGPSGWTVGTVTVNAANEGGTPVTANYTQSGYSLTHSTAGIPDKISGAPQTIPVTFTGNCPAFGLRYRVERSGLSTS